MKAYDLAVVLVKVLGLSVLLHGIVAFIQGVGAVMPWICMQFSNYEGNSMTKWGSFLVGYLSMPLYAIAGMVVGVVVVKKATLIVEKYLKIPRE